MVHVIRVSEEGEEKNYIKEQWLQAFQIWQRLWTFRSKKTKNLNHKEHEENYTETHHNQIA